MGWSDKFVNITPDKRVRYSFVKRDGSEFYYVRFIDPTGKKVKRSTEETLKTHASDAASRIILAEYNQATPPSEAITWEVAKERLRAAMETDGKARGGEAGEVVPG